MNRSHDGGRGSLEKLERLETLTEVVTGKAAVPQGGGPVQLPDKAAVYVSFKAGAENAGPVELRGTGGEGAGWPLAPGEQFGPAYVANLNAFELAAGEAGDSLFFQIHR